MAELIWKDGEGWRREMRHSMLRRCHGWDYYGAGYYMITLVLRDRSRPLLGDLVIDCARPGEVKAHVQLSELGRQVVMCWRQVAEHEPLAMPLLIQVMPEHLHAVLHVMGRMRRPLGNVIGGFKAGCTAAFRQFFPGAGALFADGYHDRIIHHPGMLDRVMEYLRDNPRRLAVRRLFPDYFQVQREIPVEGGWLSAVGNSFLLEYPQRWQVQISRSIPMAEFEAQSRRLLELASNRDVVLVSPCISPGEREIAHRAFERKAPLVVLRNRRFPAHYKPSGAYFDACADGRLLMAAPVGWPCGQRHDTISRNEACVLNAIAQRICGEGAAEIHYRGMVPAELERLVAEALARPL